jgi:hypothetical protein
MQPCKIIAETASYLKTIHDDAATAKVFGLNYMLTTLGAILPVLVEMLSKKMTHRGVSHSAAISIFAMVILWSTPIRYACIGVVFGHLFMDSRESAKARESRGQKLKSLISELFLFGMSMTGMYFLVELNKLIY